MHLSDLSALEMDQARASGTRRHAKWGARPNSGCEPRNRSRIVQGVKRVMIIGSGGAGKSTLARRLGERLEIPVVHLDAHFWKPGWIPTPKAEWLETELELMRPEAWILDGNFGGSMDARLALADTVIFMDLPRLTCIARVLKRRVQHHGRSRPDMAAGCPEKIDLEFLRWIWDFPRTKRPGILKKLEATRRAGTRVVHLRSVRDLNRFLETSADFQRVQV
jgi:adenylate kinase family enzyme